jgi:hypothetical protein
MRVDDIYGRLKQHDLEWLSATLDRRWNQISTSVNHGDGKIEQSTRLPLLAHPQRQTEASRDKATEVVWPYDVTISKLQPGREVSTHINLIRSNGHLVIGTKTQRQYVHVRPATCRCVVA